MKPRRRIGGTGPAGDKADAGPSRRLAASFCHDGGAALVPANGDGDIAVMKGIERREIALAGHAKHVPHSMHEELIDQNFGGGPRAVIGAHHASPWLCSSRLHHAASMWGGQTSQARVKSPARP
jgi:hypothetical protein